MSNPTLRILTGQAEDPTLRDRVDEVLEEQRVLLSEAIDRWVMYAAQSGLRKLLLTECPGYAKADQDWIVEYLRSQGLKVKVPRWWGFPTVELEPEEDVDG